MRFICSLAVAIVIFFLLSNARALAVSCESIFARDENPYASMADFDAHLAAKYPEHAVVLKDPKAFVAEMKRRSNEARALGRHAYDFDYSETGLPALKLAIPKIELRITQLWEERARLGASRLFPPLRNFLLEQTGWSILFLGELKTEALAHLERQSISNLQTNEYFHYFTRAMGHYQPYENGLRSKFFTVLGRVYLGYRQGLGHSEYMRYRNREFQLFSAVPLAQGFKRTSQPFAKKFEAADDLVALLIPSFSDLGRDIFQRHMTTQVSFIGVGHQEKIENSKVTIRPHELDGLVMPNGDFRSHDLRHEAGKYEQLSNYLEKRNIRDETAIEKIVGQQEQWFLELSREIELIPDPALRATVELISFIHHHDRGFPFSPSMWFEAPQRFKVYELVIALKLTGHTQLASPVRGTRAAFSWLSAFWQKRRAAESRLLTALIN